MRRWDRRLGADPRAITPEPYRWPRRLIYIAEIKLNCHLGSIHLSFSSRGTKKNRCHMESPNQDSKGKTRRLFPSEMGKKGQITSCIRCHIQPGEIIPGCGEERGRVKMSKMHVCYERGKWVKMQNRYK
jgi:hypothetical protein